VRGIVSSVKFTDFLKDEYANSVLYVRRYETPVSTSDYCLMTKDNLTRMEKKRKKRIESLLQKKSSYVSGLPGALACQ